MAIRKPPFPVTPGQSKDAYHQQQLKPKGRTSAMPAGDRKGPRRVCSLQGPPHPLPPALWPFLGRSLSYSTSCAPPWFVVHRPTTA